MSNIIETDNFKIHQDAEGRYSPKNLTQLGNDWELYLKDLCPSTNTINEGYVYIFLNSRNEVKVGVSQNPYKRLITIQRSGGSFIKDMFISKRCSNYFDIERNIHNKFKCDKIIGEYFSCDLYDCILYADSLNFIKDFITIDKDAESEAKFKLNEYICKIIGRIYKDDELLHPAKFDDKYSPEFIDGIQTDDEFIPEYVGLYYLLKCRDNADLLTLLQKKETTLSLKLLDKIAVLTVFSCLAQGYSADDALDTAIQFCLKDSVIY